MSNNTGEKKDISKNSVSNGDFVPYIEPEKSIPEFTLRATILGVVLAIVFGAANAYLGLKVGMTVSASIPAAVISMAILRGLMKTGTILENNIVQTVGSSGESLAAGVIFTIPALMFLAEEYPEQIIPPSIWTIFLLSLLGGCLGILFMIPLRRYLIVREHKVLPFPEGTACAEVLIAGEAGGSKAKIVGMGLLVGAVYKILMSGFRLFKESVTYTIQPFNKATIGSDLTPALLGVGFIIGPKISAMMFAGGLLGWIVFLPLINQIGSYLTIPIPPAELPISQLAPDDIWSNYIRYIGAGAVATGGLVSLIKAIPVIIQSFKLGFSEGILSQFKKQEPSIKNQASSVKRTDKDLSMNVVIIGSLIVAVIMFIILELSMKQTLLNIFASLIVVIFGFFFVTVASRIVGIVGSSSSPVSGMTLTTLLITSLIFVWMGWTGPIGMASALTVGAIVCIAICMSGDISQDLKTGFLLGATPRSQQISEFIGVIIPATVIGWTLFLLHKAYGFGAEPGQLSAPQATLMSLVVKGVMSGTLPWAFVITGIFVGLVIELLGISSLPFAIGLYLPVSLSTPIIVGGLIYYIMQKFIKSEELLKKSEGDGILYSSGLVAGDAFMGVVIAFFVWITHPDTIKMYAKFLIAPDSIIPFLNGMQKRLDPSTSAVLGDLGSVIVFAILSLTLMGLVMRRIKN